MSETPVYTGRAVVYYLDTVNKSWAGSGVSGYTRLDIYKHNSNGTYRVIGRGIEDTSKVVINSNITKDTIYTRARETFHQFQDPSYMYGLNFATKVDADGFASQFDSAVSILKSGGNTLPKPAPPAAKPGPPTPSMKPQPPSGGPSSGGPSSGGASSGGASAGGPSSGGPPSAPKPPAPPPPGKKAPPPTGERGALLGSIANFSKDNLKRAETDDRSVPIILTEKKDADGGGSLRGASAGHAPKSSLGGGGDMMSEILRKQQSMKSSPASHAPPPTREPSQSSLKAAPRNGSYSSAPSPVLTQPVTPARTASREKITKPEGNRGSSDFPAKATPRTGSGSSTLSPELLALKEEIMAEVRAELELVKQSIIDAINSR